MVLLNPTSYAVLYIAAIIKGVGNAALSGVMYGMLADTVEYNDWKSGIRVIFLYVPLVVFAIMFIILLFYKLDKEYGHIVEDLEKRAKRA